MTTHIDKPSKPSPDLAVITIGMAVILVFVLWGVLDPEGLDASSAAGLGWVIGHCSWLFVVAADFFLVLAFVIALGRYGRIKLGADGDRPEFTTLAWVAMMFTAGMGIGLIFYGVAEPLTHFTHPVPGAGGPAGSAAAGKAALGYTFFHWTLHPWAIYAIAGVALAYATFRKHRGNSVSAAFVPLIGDRRAKGGLGRAIDLLAVFATVFGSATSLGLGSLQVAAGLNLIAGVRESRALVLILIGALTAAFVVSASTGIHKGVKWLSTFNVVLEVTFMLFVFLVGPTVYLLDLIPPAVGGYLSGLVERATRTGALSDREWMGDWTVFYWAWWLSWAPFVGTFLARISRGRTIRQFVFGVLLIPSGASIVWFSIMGGTAIHTQQTGRADLAASLDDGPEGALFGMLDSLPLYGITAIVCIVMIGVYFVTGADSASLVLGSLSSRGALIPPRWLVVLWGVLIGAVAAVLLIAGGLEALKQATILVALPFVLVMLLLCWALFRDLRADPALGGPNPRPARGLREAVGAEVGARINPARPNRPADHKADDMREA